MKYTYMVLFWALVPITLLVSACDSDEEIEASLCDEIVCDSPPAEACDGDMLKVAQNLGQCNEATGKCEYPEDVTACEYGCKEGKCLTEGSRSCNDNDCISPPANECENDNELRVYESKGKCSADDVCEYLSDLQSCDHGCRDGKCVTPEEKCQDLLCNDPPEKRCVDDWNLEFFEAGLCNPDTGKCEYPSKTERCENGCQNNQCLVDLCKGVTCLEPPPAACTGENELEIYSAEGSCNEKTGTCEYSADISSCPWGCQNNQCNECNDDRICADVPASICSESNDELIVFEGKCGEDGKCDYMEKASRIPCPFGCENGQCLQCDPDRCRALNPTKVATCDDDNLVEYRVTCLANECVFTPEMETCEFGCESGRCNDCVESQCSKESTCEENNKIVYVGKCDNNTCAYDTEAVPCDFGCTDGACNECDASKCSAPPICHELDGKVYAVDFLTFTCDDDNNCQYVDIDFAECEFGCIDGECNSCEANQCKAEKPICANGIRTIYTAQCNGTVCERDESKEHCQFGCAEDNSSCADSPICKEDCVGAHQECVYENGSSSCVCEKVPEYGYFMTSFEGVKKCCPYHSSNKDGRCVCDQMYFDPTGEEEICLRKCGIDTYEEIYRGHCEDATQYCHLGNCIPDPCYGKVAPENGFCIRRLGKAEFRCNDYYIMSKDHCCPENSTYNEGEGKCVCDAGYDESKNGSCLRSEENLCEPNPCSGTKSRCVYDADAAEKYSCVCPRGYKEEGNSCVIAEIVKQCPDDMTCKAGYCVQDNPTDQQCVVDSECGDVSTRSCNAEIPGGKCQGEEGLKCPDNMYWSGAYSMGSCLKICGTDDDCPFGKCYEYGAVCKIHECHSDADCFQGSVCRGQTNKGKGQCLRIACREAEPECSIYWPNGKCANANEVCFKGECVSSCSDQLCADKLNMECFQEHPETEPPRCRCSDGYYLNADGQCEAEPLEECPGGFSCDSKVCVETNNTVHAQCNSDSECPSGMSCNREIPYGRCARIEDDSTVDCHEGYYYYKTSLLPSESGCHKKCSSADDCPSGDWSCVSVGFGSSKAKICRQVKCNLDAASEVCGANYACIAPPGKSSIYARCRRQGC